MSLYDVGGDVLSVRTDVLSVRTDMSVTDERNVHDYFQTAFNNYQQNED